MSEENLENLFPNLKLTDYAITSEEDVDYNCIAWAVGDSRKWTSKIGELEDIGHDGLSALEGEAYGNVAQIMKRPSRIRGGETID
jgi:hypothetical protein